MTAEEKKSIISHLDTAETGRSFKNGSLDSDPSVGCNSSINNSTLETKHQKILFFHNCYCSNCSFLGIMKESWCIMWCNKPRIQVLVT